MCQKLVKARAAGRAGWIRRFAYGNGWAWEQDWKGRFKPGGGMEYRYIDTVDLAYFAGHGNSSGFYFGVGGDTHDDRQLRYSDCRLDWGDGDAEWVGIAACNVLADSHKRDWAWCMDGLHLILGFVTTMADVSHGDWFGWYISRGYNMTQAWFKAADALQPSGKIARVLAEERCHFYDTMFRQCPDAWDNDYWQWSHRVGSEPARYVDPDQLGGTMPVFQTPPLSLAEAEAKWEQLGEAFDVPTGGAFRLTQDEPIWASEDEQLEMDPSSGLFSYTDLDNLWAAPPETLAGSSRTRKLTQQDARDIADHFLTSNGLMPEDAQFYEVVGDTLAEEGIDRTGSGLALQEFQEPETTAWQVIYSRILTYTPPGTRSNQEPVEFSVVGPGAKLKVYVAPEAAVGLAAAQQPVIGGVGGWRRAGQAGSKMRAVQQTVPILAYEQIEKLFEQLESTVALSYVPLVFDSREVLTHTVAYYEHPLGTGQDQLIPVYVLEVESNLVNGEVVTSPVHIPANSTYMAPLAQITPVSEIPSTVAVGEELVFEAADASTDLSDLGYDASLDFPLGTGDPDSYLYTWYRDTVADENQIGTGRVLTYTVGLSRGAHSGGGSTSQSIILEVRDNSSPRPPSTSTATYQINVVPPAYLPLIMRTHAP